jgi:quercetin dioxygenase-like cupin family protein
LIVKIKTVKMSKKSIVDAIGIILVSTLFISAFAQSSGIRRTELQRHDLAVPGREAIQVRVDFDPGTKFGRHSHPGEELVFVIEGVFEYEVEGMPPVKLKAGEVLFIPAGKIHSAKNIGKVKASELATYIVEKGKPLVVLSE